MTGKPGAVRMCHSWPVVIRVCGVVWCGVCPGRHHRGMPRVRLRGSQAHVAPEPTHHAGFEPPEAGQVAQGLPRDPALELVVADAEHLQARELSMRWMECVRACQRSAAYACIMGKLEVDDGFT
jgi:hypothetical protein